MHVVSTPQFREDLKAALLPLIATNPQQAKSFKLYLDTILLNLPTKANKYKPSLYIDDPDARDIEHQGYTIPFYYDKNGAAFIILGMIDNRG